MSEFVGYVGYCIYIKQALHYCIYCIVSPHSAQTHRTVIILWFECFPIYSLILSDWGTLLGLFSDFRYDSLCAESLRRLLIPLSKAEKAELFVFSSVVYVQYLYLKRRRRSASTKSTKPNCKFCIRTVRTSAKVCHFWCEIKETAESLWMASREPMEL